MGICDQPRYGLGILKLQDLSLDPVRQLEMKSLADRVTSLDADTRRRDARPIAAFA